MLFTSLKWTSNSSQQTPLHPIWENPFCPFFQVNPRGHTKLLCFPAVCLLCLSAAAHRSGFYSHCFSSGSVYAWLDPGLLTWWRRVQSVWESDLLFVWCGVHGYCFRLLSARSSWTQMCEENFKKSDKLTCVQLICLLYAEWLTSVICCVVVPVCSLLNYQQSRGDAKAPVTEVRNSRTFASTLIEANVGCVGTVFMWFPDFEKKVIT